MTERDSEVLAMVTTTPERLWATSAMRLWSLSPASLYAVLWRLTQDAEALAAHPVFMRRLRDRVARRVPERAGRVA